MTSTTHADNIYQVFTISSSLRFLSLKILPAIIASAILSGCITGKHADRAIDLSGEWRVRYDSTDIGLEEGWERVETGDWASTIVPDATALNSYDGIVWYSRDITRPEFKSNLALLFEAVDDNVQVFINGNLVGRHQGWGQQFWFDITDRLSSHHPNRLTIRLEDSDGPGGIIDAVWLRPYATEEDMASKFSKMTAHEGPAWAREGILYEVFVRDFSSSGDFQGLIDGLDGLKDLGVTILWLMPIHPIGKELRKGRLGSPYSIRDYYAVNPDFGTLDDFERLVKEVHHRDMRIILDMVPNHSAWDNTLLQEHPEWFSRDASGQIVAPNSDWTDVADFNYEQPGLQKYIRDMLNWWVREYDVDGFRIDVAELMPADFWAETRTSLKAADPDIFLLAEGSRPYLHVSGFDATYAFNTFNKFISLANGFSDVSAIHQTMKAEQGSYPQGSLRMRFLENHDQRRAAEVIASEQRLVAASVGIFLLPGLPMLYNGSELGLDHRLELFDRDPIQWDTGSEGYRSLLRELFALRKQYPALINGEYRPHDVAPNVLAYSRHHGNESVLVLVNFGEQKVNVELPTVANLIGELLLSTDGIIYLPDENLVILEPFSGAVLR